MPVEVYSASKPASPARAWLLSTLLLALASALALPLTRGETNPASLGDRIEPVGWNLSFRVPAGFLPADSPPDRFSTASRFLHVDPRGATRELTFWRLRAPLGTTPLTVCREVLDAAESWVTRLFGPPRARISAVLADRPAVELQNPATNMIVRSILLDDGWAFAVSIRTAGKPLDEDDYRLFDRTCRAVRIRSK